MAPQEKGRLTSVIGPTPISRNWVRAKAQGGTALGGESERFPAGFGRPEVARSRPLELQRQVVRVRLGKERPRALVEQVGIEAFGLQQRDPPLPDRPFRLDRRKLRRKLANLLVDVLPGVEAMIAGEGVDPEIADQQRRRGIEAERRENRSKPPAGDHGISCDPRGIKVALTAVVVSGP